MLAAAAAEFATVSAPALSTAFAIWVLKAAAAAWASANPFARASACAAASAAARAARSAVRAFNAAASFCVFAVAAA